MSQPFRRIKSQHSFIHLGSFEILYLFAMGYDYLIPIPLEKQSQKEQDVTQEQTGRKRGEAVGRKKKSTTVKCSQVKKSRIENLVSSQKADVILQQLLYERQALRCDEAPRLSGEIDPRP